MLVKKMKMIDAITKLKSDFAVLNDKIGTSTHEYMVIFWLRNMNEVRILTSVVRCERSAQLRFLKCIQESQNIFRNPNNLFDRNERENFGEKR